MGETKSTKAVENERLRWEIKGGDSAKGQHKMHEGVNYNVKRENEGLLGG